MGRALCGGKFCELEAARLASRFGEMRYRSMVVGVYDMGNKATVLLSP